MLILGLPNPVEAIIMGKKSEYICKKVSDSEKRGVLRGPVVK